MMNILTIYYHYNLFKFKYTHRKKIYIKFVIKKIDDNDDNDVSSIIIIVNLHDNQNGFISNVLLYK